MRQKENHEAIELRQTTQYFVWFTLAL